MATSRGFLPRLRRTALYVFVLLMQLASEPLAQAQDGWSGSIGAATDYIYRGVTQSNGEPAAHGAVRFDSPEGWSIGAWSSTVDLDRNGGRGYELDLYATRSWSWGPAWSGALGIAHREYLRDHSGLDYDHDELSASLSFQQRVTASVAWSPNTSLYWNGPLRGRAIAYELTFQQPLGAGVSLFAGAGRYDLQDLVRDSYSYWSAGVTFTWASLQLDAAHIGASDAAAHYFGYEASRGRWTGALSVRF